MSRTCRILGKPGSGTTGLSNVFVCLQLRLALSEHPNEEAQVQRKKTYPKNHSQGVENSQFEEDRGQGSHDGAEEKKDEVTRKRDVRHVCQSPYAVVEILLIGARCRENRAERPRVLTNGSVAAGDKTINLYRFDIS